MIMLTKFGNPYIPQKNYIDFDPSDFIKNRIVLARMKAKITQTSLAKSLNGLQAYISKIENDEYKVTKQLFTKINSVIEKLAKQQINTKSKN